MIQPARRLFPALRKLLLIACCLGLAAAADAQIPIEDSVAQAAPDADGAFVKVEVEASFPGGPAGWRTYLMQNLNADVGNRRGVVAGTYTIKVQFIVDRDGRVSNVKALNDPGYGLAQEAVRVIRKGPRWVPAEQGGRKVKAYRTQPIVFVYSN